MAFLSRVINVYVRALRRPGIATGLPGLGSLGKEGGSLIEGVSLTRH